MMGLREFFVQRMRIGRIMARLVRRGIIRWSPLARLRGSRRMQGFPKRRGHAAIPVWFLLSATLLLVQPAVSTMDAGAMAPAGPDSSLAAVLGALPGERIGLAALLAAANEQAVAARLADADLAAAEAALRSERGAFDPELFGSATWTGSDQPAASLFSGAPVVSNETAEIEAGARMTPAPLASFSLARGG